jgi:hypothetical protein
MTCVRIIATVGTYEATVADAAVRVVVPRGMFYAVTAFNVAKVFA